MAQDEKVRFHALPQRAAYLSQEARARQFFRAVFADEREADQQAQEFLKLTRTLAAAQPEGASARQLAEQFYRQWAGNESAGPAREREAQAETARAAMTEMREANRAACASPQARRAHLEIDSYSQSDDLRLLLETPEGRTRAEIEATRKAFIILGGVEGTNFIRFNATEREMRVLDKQVWFVRQVAAIFQISTARLRLAVDTSRANTEAMLANDEEGVRALLWRICELENAKLLGSFGAVQEHNCRLTYPIMSRRDEKEQAEISTIQTGGQAWAAINEAREVAGLEKLEESFADEALIDTPAGPLPLTLYAERVRGSN